MLDPQAQALMQLMVEKGVPPVYTLTPTEARESYRSRRTFTQPDAAEVFKVNDKVALANGLNVPVRVYHPLPRKPKRTCLAWFTCTVAAGPLAILTRTTCCAEVCA